MNTVEKNHLPQSLDNKTIMTILYCIKLQPIFLYNAIIKNNPF